MCVHVCLCVAMLLFYWGAQTVRKLVRALCDVMRAAYILSLAHDNLGGYSSTVVFHRV